MKISVVIPFYNRSQLLRGSLTSVLKQTRAVHEIIVVDDSSPEEIGWLGKEFPMVKVIRLPKNLGAAGARYKGVLAASGTHIATLDADDFWYPQKLEKQMAYVAEIGDERGIYSHQQWVEEGGWGTIRPRDGPRPGEPTTEYLYVRGGFIQSNTLLIERALYLELCLVSLKDNLYADDCEIVMRADVLKCQIYLLKEVLSQWNNIASDPKRISTTGNPISDRNYLPRQASYLTPKALTAFRGRWLAPRLIQAHQTWDGLRLIIQACTEKAISPLSGLKIFIHAAFPGVFKNIVHCLDFLRGHGCTSPQVPLIKTEIGVSRALRSGR